jgi:hypothetical protein
MSHENNFPGLQPLDLGNGTIAMYWVALGAAIAAGYPIKAVRLYEPDGSAELDERCQDLESRMMAWLTYRENADKPIVFDGTIAGLIEIYLTHPCSPFHEKRTTTQRTYQYNSQKLHRTVGRCRLSELNRVDFLRWYEQFKESRWEAGPERISHAHHLIAMLRTAFSFGVQLDLPHAKRLRDALSAIKFPPARPAYRRDHL